MILAGLLGREIQASRSPMLHEGEARALGFEMTYELLDFTARGLGDILEVVAAKGFCGVNVTFPFKQAIIPLLDELHDCAAAVGAVNTVAIRDGRFIGYNTDMVGFCASAKLGLSGARFNQVLQFGAGGAGAAVAHALMALGTGRLVIADIDSSRAEALCDRLNSIYQSGQATTGPVEQHSLHKFDGIVNASPMGMKSQPSPPFDTALISAHQWIADIVYFPLETRLLQDARARGCRLLNGSGMVIAQAAQAFEIMTGHSADIERMRQSFVSSLG